MPAEKLTKHTVKGLAWSLATLLAQVILNVLSVAILARLLTPHDYGIMSAATIIVAFAASLSGLGLVPTIIQRKEISQSHISTALALCMGIGILLAGLQWLCAPLVAEALKLPEATDVIRTLSLVTLIQSLVTLYEAVLSRNFKFKQIGLIRLWVWAFTSFGIAVPLAWFGFGYWSLVISTICQNVLSLVFMILFARQRLTKAGIQFKAVKELFANGLGYSITQIMAFVSTYSDNIVVSRVLGGVELGIYSRAFYLISIPSNLFGNVNRMVVFPAMSQIQDDNARLRNAYLRGLSLTSLVCIPASAFLATCAENLVDVLLGNQWGAAVIPFAVFSLAIYFRVGAKTCGTVLQAKGRAYSLAALQTFYAISIAAGAALASPFGLNAICLAILAVAAMNFATVSFRSSRIIESGLGGFLALHIRPLVIGAFIAIASYAAQTLLAGAPPYLAIIAAMGASGLPLLLALYLRPLWILGHHGAEALRAFGGPLAKIILPPSHH